MAERQRHLPEHHFILYAHSASCVQSRRGKRIGGTEASVQARLHRNKQDRQTRRDIECD